MAKKRWQNDKQWFTKHYTANCKLSNKNPTEKWMNSGGPNEKQCLFHYWHPSWYYCDASGGQTLMRKGWDCDYDKGNISVVIGHTDIH